MKRILNTRIDLLLWASNEMARQFEEARQEQVEKYFGAVDACPCGCGLRGDVCSEELGRVELERLRQGIDDLPF